MSLHAVIDLISWGGVTPPQQLSNKKTSEFFQTSEVLIYFISINPITRYERINVRHARLDEHADRKIQDRADHHRA